MGCELKKKQVVEIWTTLMCIPAAEFEPSFTSMACPPTQEKLTFNWYASRKKVCDIGSSAMDFLTNYPIDNFLTVPLCQ